MATFIIAPHMRLHEWIAEEKGYFRDTGLAYEFREQLTSADGKRHNLGDRVGAYQSFESGRTCDVSSACHWTVNMAAAAGHGRLYAGAYSVAPCGVYVAAENCVHETGGSGKRPISVGYQSGSHYSTLEALDHFLKPDQIAFLADGLLFRRMERVFDREVAASTSSAPGAFLEQHGFRKIVDTSFMMAIMVAEDAEKDDVEKYLQALRRAQTDIDLHAHRYTHHYRNEFPVRFHELMDTRLFGPGERSVFEPYTREMYLEPQRWILERGIFVEGNPIQRTYDESIAEVGGG